MIKSFDDQENEIEIHHLHLVGLFLILGFFNQ